MHTTHTLTRAQLRELHLELERERARLDRTLRLSTATAMTVMEPGPTTVERTQSRLDTVVAALHRLADGSYGICPSCGDPIPYPRLLVIPETIHCRGCGGR